MRCASRNKTGVETMTEAFNSIKAKVLTLINTNKSNKVNIDVINTKSGKALKQKDRKKLHNCETRLLHEVIKLINPTHIIFFGWHNTSLEHEAPNLLNIAYPNGVANNSFIKSENFIFETKLNGKNIILSYHPNYVPIRNNKNYIFKLIRLIKQEN